MYFYDDLKIEVLFQHPYIVIILGECADCGLKFPAHSYQNITEAKKQARARFRNHIAKDTNERCLSGTNSKAVERSHAYTL